MPPVNRFEDLIAWQKARVLAKDVYLIIQTGRFAKDFGLSGQIQRAASSVMFNVAEGFERGSRAEFHQFLSIAKGSCGEVRAQLYLALDLGYLEKARFATLMASAEEVGGRRDRRSLWWARGGRGDRGGRVLRGEGAQRHDEAHVASDGHRSAIA